MSQSTKGAATTDGRSNAGAAAEVRLGYLDGLRGLAALYVAMHHAYYGLTAEVTLPHRLALVTYWLYLGRSGVDVFIVLSGYCLMIPVVRAGKGWLPHGTAEFFRRRALRILPPYYAAMGVSLLGIVLLPELHRFTGVNALWNESLPASTPGVILSHLLLIHNCDPAWHSKIDYPMWSVATEWQIYFLFPLMLIPIWRRFGVGPVLVAAFAAGVITLCLWFDRFSGISPQFLGLFTLGIVAADINFTKRPPLVRMRDRLPWGVMAAGAALAVGILSLFHIKWAFMVAVKDVIVGAATAFLLVYCTRSMTAEGAYERPPLVMRILESRPVLGLGAFSYSLYLLHAPALAICQYWVRRMHLSPTVSLAMMLFGGVTFAVVCAYIFHLAFERPFMRRRANKEPRRVAAHDARI